MKITFGKYKNQDLSIVYNDKNYKNWLLNQKFFKDEYSEEYEYLKNYTEVKKEKEDNSYEVKRKRFLNMKHNYYHGERCECGKNKKQEYWCCYNCNQGGMNKHIFMKWNYDGMGGHR